MKALERRFGARAVDVDSMEGWCRFALVEPQDLSFDTLHSALESANYSTRKIYMEVEAEVLKKDGDSFVLRIQGTNQEIRVQCTNLTPGNKGYVLISADVDPDKDVVSSYRASPGSLEPRAPRLADQ